MKRTTILIDEKLLAEGLRLGRASTVSELLRKALAEYVRTSKARQILDYLGSGVWEGNLSEMRGDKGPAPLPRRKRKPRK